MTFKENGKDHIDVLSNSIRIIFLELRKYEITNENLGNMLTTWVQFLKKPSSIKTNKVNDKCLDKAMKRLNYISTDDNERAMIDAIESGRKESNTTIYNAEQKGLKQGLKQGKEEMARILLQSGVDINIISQSSGLTVDQIQELTKK
jgi:predicted transposase/invertase (TIGR01784 family)